MVTSFQPLKDVFFCPDKSDFYSHCLEALVLKNCVNSECAVEFGSGDGSPVIKSLLRTEFKGSIHGFELNSLACQIANSKIKQYHLSSKYTVHNQCLFDAPKPHAAYLVSNPPYLPALDNNIYQPLLHGGIDGITVAQQLLSLNYQNVALPVRVCLADSEMPAYQTSQTKIGKVSKPIT